MSLSSTGSILSNTDSLVSRLRKTMFLVYAKISSVFYYFARMGGDGVSLACLIFGGKQ